MLSLLNFLPKTISLYCLWCILTSCMLLPSPDSCSLIASWHCILRWWCSCLMWCSHYTESNSLAIPSSQEKTSIPCLVHLLRRRPFPEYEDTIPDGRKKSTLPSRQAVCLHASILTLESQWRDIQSNVLLVTMTVNQAMYLVCTTASEILLSSVSDIVC